MHGNSYLGGFLELGVLTSIDGLGWDGRRRPMEEGDDKGEEENRLDSRFEAGPLALSLRLSPPGCDSAVVASERCTPGSTPYGDSSWASLLSQEGQNQDQESKPGVGMRPCSSHSRTHRRYVAPLGTSIVALEEMTSIVLQVSARQSCSDGPAFCWMRLMSSVGRETSLEADCGCCGAIMSCIDELEEIQGELGVIAYRLWRLEDGPSAIGLIYRALDILGILDIFDMLRPGMKDEG
ncbi:hypothetical protein L249_4155 [Ophiocordyceps polyrhachis-furcata BCC 54312]|uniref:Uncharacterized protein n=1 Tax=Ophiocordyceps polyrhachis-furcata BCC 54312 TaxID=1330021 RepID=A0A367L6D2_9HYPO|nr:hypothetical protein L249_4155 [Ophiocordyceps polyrhachis-furcata BCC 54312]